MSNQLKMARIHTIEQLLAHGWSHRRIARELDIHRDTVARYARRPPDPDSKPAISTAGSSELIEPPPDSKPAISTAGSGDVIDPPADPKPAITTAGVAGRKCECDPHRETIVAKLAIGLSAQRIHQDLVAEHGYTHSYESVKRFVRKLGASRPIPFRRMETLPGEEAQIDYGLGAFTIKPGSKKKKRPQLLRVVLSHSRKAYSEVMWCQDTESLIRGIENAFHHFGGVPKTLVPDNLKAAVLEHDWCDPTITPKFEAFARHYGVAVLPTKPRTPRHKGKVERCVAFAQDNALKGRQFASLAAQNELLRDWETKVADQRIHGTTRKQVHALFEADERHALLPLPAERFPLFHETQRTVHRDGHIVIEKAFYSVPPEFLGRPVWVRYDSRLVRIFDHALSEIALHVRVDPGRFSTDRAHIVDEKISAIERGTEWMLERAARIGEESARYAQALLSYRGIAGIRVLQGFLGLTKKHSWEEIERACRVALSHHAYRLKTLRRLLEQQPAATQQLEFIDSHPLIRDPHEYGEFVQDAFSQSTFADRRPA